MQQNSMRKREIDSPWFQCTATYLFVCFFVDLFVCTLLFALFICIFSLFSLFFFFRNTEYQEFATEYLNSLEAQLQAKGLSIFFSPVSVSVCVSVSVSVCLSASVYLCLCLSLSLFACLSLPICVSVSVCVSVFISVSVSVYLSVSVSVSVFVYLCVCLCLCVSFLMKILRASERQCPLNGVKAAAHIRQCRGCMQQSLQHQA